MYLFIGGCVCVSLWITNEIFCRYAWGCRPCPNRAEDQSWYNWHHWGRVWCSEAQSDIFCLMQQARNYGMIGMCPCTLVLHYLALPRHCVLIQRITLDDLHFLQKLTWSLILGLCSLQVKVERNPQLSRLASAIAVPWTIELPVYHVL
jgi:hypothetical protein